MAAAVLSPDAPAAARRASPSSTTGSRGCAAARRCSRRSASSTRTRRSSRWSTCPASVSPAIERHRPQARRSSSGCPAPAATTATACRSSPPRSRRFDLDEYDLVHQQQPLRGQVGRAGPGAPATSATATRRCATCGTSARRTSARNGSGGAGARAIRPVLAWLARWDVATARRVDRYLANSQHVARRIRRYYNRRAEVVPPPVDTEFFRPDGRPAGRFCPGRVGAGAVQAARPRRRRLPAGRDPAVHRRAGAGDATAAGPGWRRRRSCWAVRSDEEIRELYRACAMVLLPGEEDFGIVPVEAQACGRPVVALGAAARSRRWSTA